MLQTAFLGGTIAIGALISAANWLLLFRTRTVSPIPVVGALFLAFGLAGFETTRRYAWLAPIIDYGTLAMFISLPRRVLEAWQTRSFQLEQRFITERPGSSVALCLFKSHIFTITAAGDTPLSCNTETVIRVTAYGFRGHWETTNETLILSAYDGNRLLRIHPDGDGLFTSEETVAGHRTTGFNSLDGLEFRRLPSTPSGVVRTTV